MSKHLEFITKFDQRLKSGTHLNRDEEPDRQLILQMLIKCADISNVTKQWETSTLWSKRITEEFFQQVSILYSTLLYSTLLYSLSPPVQWHSISVLWRRLNWCAICAMTLTFKCLLKGRWGEEIRSDTSDDDGPTENKWGEEHAQLHRLCGQTHLCSLGIFSPFCPSVHREHAE